ncbi:MAG: ATP-binding protein [Desulfovermiculus sp.]
MSRPSGGKALFCVMHMIKAFLAYGSRKFNRLKVKHKFALAILANIALVLVVFVVLIHSYQKQNLIQNQERKNESLVRNMASEAVDPILVKNYLQLDMLVKSVQEAGSARDAYIMDSSGKVLAHTDKSFLGEQVIRSELDSHRLGQAMDWSDQGIRLYTRPITVQDSVLGHAVLGVDQEQEALMVARDLRGLHKTLALVSGLLFVVGMVSSSFLAGLLTQRLSCLKQNMQQVQHGNLNVEIPCENQVSEHEVFLAMSGDCPTQDRCLALEKGFLNIPQQCLQCSVYELACGDEVGELNLAFNQMVQDLRQNIRKLEQANLEKSRMERLSLLGQMSAQVAHEVKNPLNSIIGAAHYLRTNFEGQILREFLQIIEEESQRLSDIVTNFLNFSKPAQPSLVHSDVNEVVRNTISLVERELEEKGVHVVFEPDQALRPFKLDAAKIKQALLNILLNASQATQAGDNLEVSTAQESGQVVLKVSDTGCGMDQEALDNMFKPFFTTKVRGSGLGLAIAEQNIRDLGGSIQVESTEGHGSTFTIMLPVQ